MPPQQQLISEHSGTSSPLNSTGILSYPSSAIILEYFDGLPWWCDPSLNPSRTEMLDSHSLLSPGWHIPIPSYNRTRVYQGPPSRSPGLLRVLLVRIVQKQPCLFLLVSVSCCYQHCNSFFFLLISGHKESKVPPWQNSVGCFLCLLVPFSLETRKSNTAEFRVEETARQNPLVDHSWGVAGGATPWFLDPCYPSSYRYSAIDRSLIW